MTPLVEELFVSLQETLRECIAAIDRGGRGIALVVDDRRRLVATLTDGDVRRAILAGLDLDRSAAELLARRGEEGAGPVVAAVGTPKADLIRLMTEHVIRHAPLLDEDGRVVEIALLDELVSEYQVPLRALIMAGGYGTRLRPLTEQTPKPMLPVGDRPLLERTIEQLRTAGIHRLKLATHYRADVIEEHFGDGRDFGVEIEYVNEDYPLGTAGALSLVRDSDEPILVLNGDILTKVDFRAMLRFHTEHEADMTVAVRHEEFGIPYGVVEVSDVEVTGISEKPLLRFLVNAGIYLLSPDVGKLLEPGEPCDMPRLIGRILERDGRVVGFPVHEYWIDIGRSEDYARAIADLEGNEP